jgi:hypothetical protein
MRVTESVVPPTPAAESSAPTVTWLPVLFHKLDRFLLKRLPQLTHKHLCSLKKTVARSHYKRTPASASAAVQPGSNANRHTTFVTASTICATVSTRCQDAAKRTGERAWDITASNVHDWIAETTFHVSASATLHRIECVPRIAVRFSGVFRKCEAERSVAQVCFDHCFLIPLQRHYE